MLLPSTATISYLIITIQTFEHLHQRTFNIANKELKAQHPVEHPSRFSTKILVQKVISKIAIAFALYPPEQVNVVNSFVMKKPILRGPLGCYVIATCHQPVEAPPYRVDFRAARSSRLRRTCENRLLPLRPAYPAYPAWSGAVASRSTVGDVQLRTKKTKLHPSSPAGT